MSDRLTLADLATGLSEYRDLFGRLDVFADDVVELVETENGRASTSLRAVPGQPDTYVFEHEGDKFVLQVAEDGVARIRYADDTIAAGALLGSVFGCRSGRRLHEEGSGLGEGSRARDACRRCSRRGIDPLSIQARTDCPLRSDHARLGGLRRRSGHLAEVGARAHRVSRAAYVGVSLSCMLVACATQPAAGTAGTTTDTSATSAAASKGDGSIGDTSSAQTTTGTSGTPARACNGHAALCDRPLDEVTFPTTHNSAAATDAGFSAINANQVRDIGQQLDDGIRGMMLDVTEDGGETVLCHGPCGLGSIPHIDAIAAIGGFMDANPDEVLIIIYEDSTTSTAIAADWASGGRDALLYVKGDGAWPTLGELIDAGTRVVVTAENGAPPPAWFHHAWDLIWDTPYRFHAPEEFTCDANRGTAGEGLFLVNHWLSTDADLPDEGAAATANAYDLLLGRAQACAEQWGHPVNLLGVDFYDQGDLFAVVDVLNGV